MPIVEGAGVPDHVVIGERAARRAQAAQLIGVAEFTEACLRNRHAVGEAFDRFTPNHGAQQFVGAELVAIRALQEVDVAITGHGFQRIRLAKAPDPHLRGFVAAQIATNHHNW